MSCLYIASWAIVLAWCCCYTLFSSTCCVCGGKRCFANTPTVGKEYSNADTHRPWMRLSCLMKTHLTADACTRSKTHPHLYTSPLPHAPTGRG